MAKKNKKLKIDISSWPSDLGEDDTFENAKEKLERAAKFQVETVKDHFKKDRWDLNYSFLVQNVFYNAFGFHLENFLIKELDKSLLSYCLVGGKNGLVLTNVKLKKKARKKK